MTGSLPSLDALHDITTPDPVSYWPPAPGWVVLAVIILALAAWQGFRFWKRWKADAYRRAALKELERARATPVIAEILRRTALAVFQREEVAALTGPSWTDWLAAQSPDEMPAAVRENLSSGIYQKEATGDPSETRDYARAWIRHHLPPQAKS